MSHAQGIDSSTLCQSHHSVVVFGTSDHTSVHTHSLHVDSSGEENIDHTRLSPLGYLYHHHHQRRYCCECHSLGIITTCHTAPQQQCHRHGTTTIRRTTTTTTMAPHHPCSKTPSASNSRTFCGPTVARELHRRRMDTTLHWVSECFVVVASQHIPAVGKSTRWTLGTTDLILNFDRS